MVVESENIIWLSGFAEWFKSNALYFSLVQPACQWFAWTRWLRLANITAL